MIVDVPDDKVELLRLALFLGQERLQWAWEKELDQGTQETARVAWQRWADARYLLFKLSLT